MLSVSQRCGSRFPFEKPLKITDIIETAFHADFRNGKLCIFQKADHLIETVIVDIFNGWFADYFLKETAEILLVHVYQRRQILNVEFFLVVGADIR